MYDPVPALHIKSPDWVALPVDNQDLAHAKTSARRLTAVVWWVLVSVCMLSLIVAHDLEFIPAWFSAIMAAEGYVSVRRWVIGPRAIQEADDDAESTQPRRRRGGFRSRYVRSLRLCIDAPIDHIVARIINLDHLGCVESLDIGSQSSTSSPVREDVLCIMVTFASPEDCLSFKKTSEYAELSTFMDPFVIEHTAIEFESGVVA